MNGRKRSCGLAGLAHIQFCWHLVDCLWPIEKKHAARVRRQGSYGRERQWALLDSNDAHRHASTSCPSRLALGN